MVRPVVTTSKPTTSADAAAPVDGPAPTPLAADARLIGDDVLVEDVSIDGMCGVY